MRRNSSAARDIAFHLHPFTDPRTHERVGPLVLDRGEGVRVMDEQGRSYIEAMSGLWCASLGFSEHRLVEAAERQMRKLPFNHTFRGRSHDTVIALAEALVSLAPVPMAKAFFANSGSEANETAIKLAWAYHRARGRSQRRKIISRAGAYHGSTIAAGSLNGIVSFGREPPPAFGVLFADCPHFYRFAEPGESEEPFAKRLAARLEQLILTEGAETIAAFIAEPVMGVGGVIVPPPGYFEGVEAVLRRHDILLIADEVVCGFCRTGQRFGCQTFRFHPDIITLAKSLSSAYLPISATLISEAVYEALAAESEKTGLFAHGFTTSGHPVSAAVALEALRIYEERDIVGHVRQIGPRLQEGLRRFRGRPLVGEVRGIGLMGAVELVRHRETKVPFAREQGVGAFLAGRAAAHGLLVRPLGDTIAFSPPLVISEAEVDEVLDRFGVALSETEDVFAIRAAQ